VAGGLLSGKTGGQKKASPGNDFFRKRTSKTRPGVHLKAAKITTGGGEMFCRGKEGKRAYMPKGELSRQSLRGKKDEAVPFGKKGMRKRIETR